MKLSIDKWFDWIPPLVWKYLTQNREKVPSMCCLNPRHAALNVYTSIVYLSDCSLSFRSVKIQCSHCRYLLLIYRFELDENLLRMERFLRVDGATGASGVSEYDSITCRRPTGIPSKGTLRFSKYCVFNLLCSTMRVRSRFVLTASWRATKPWTICSVMETESKLFN